MEILYAPWRKEYVVNPHSATRAHDASSEVCVFCALLQKSAASEIITRTEHAALLFNKYPYNPGHMLVIPTRHTADLDQIPAHTHLEIMQLISSATTALKKQLRADGINVGLNLGRAAGAGIPSHLHWHIVPRWSNDTNFMSTIGETKVVSTPLHEAEELILKFFKKDE